MRSLRTVALLSAVLLAGLVDVCSAAAWDTSQTRASERRACQRLAATERNTPSGRYAFYTVGNAWKWAGPTGWASGYAVGGLWSCYELTGNDWWRRRALSREAAIADMAISADSLNLGALFYSSVVAGYRLTGREALQKRGLRAASCLAGRYNPTVGAMLSRPGQTFNVIIDSLMKSQLLWWAADNGGSSQLAEIALAHARTIARDFVRADGSTYHIVYYDPTTGAVLEKGQSSGYAQESTWARGQAWGILGFAAGYRETRNQELLAAARSVADWYLAHVPHDMVPYWDFDDPDIPLAPRDSSAAAIAASGLLDLALADPDPAHRQKYADASRATLASLMSRAYASYGDNPAVLLHGTYLRDTSDRGLVWGDAFFLEALLRLRRLTPDRPPFAIARARASAGVPDGAVDGDLTTAWVARGDQTLDLRVRGVRRVGAVRVALRRGDRGAAKLRILTSRDGRHWRLARQTMTSGETSGYETLDFGARYASWVRLSCSGTTSSRMNRIAEAEVYPEL